MKPDLKVWRLQGDGFVVLGFGIGGLGTAGGRFDFGASGFRSLGVGGIGLSGSVHMIAHEVQSLEMFRV